MVNKLQRMRQMGQTTRMKDTKRIYKFAVGVHYGQTPLELRRLVKVDITNLLKPSSYFTYQRV
jgi:hypothetical protein